MPGFDKSGRLRSRVEFTQLSRTGTKLYLKNFIIIYHDASTSVSRLGITVSRKVGNAVQRNRIKRLLREFFRNNRDSFPLADYNIIARSGAAALGHAALFQELSNGVSRVGRHSDR